MLLQISDAIQTSILILVDTNRDNMLRNVTQNYNYNSITLLILLDVLCSHELEYSSYPRYQIARNPSPHPIY